MPLVTFIFRNSSTNPCIMITVGFIEDNSFLINNYLNFLKDFQQLKVNFVYPSFESFETDAKKSEVQKVDILVLDIGLPGISGLDAITPVKQFLPSTRVLMFSGFSDEYNVVESFRRGASGFLIKSPRMMELYTAIIEVNRNGAYISAMAAAQLIRQVKHKPKERSNW